jgi:predicted nucleic acid-binding protein
LTIYVDSNYWIYWMDSRHPEHHYVCKTMRAAVREGILLNLTSLLEVAHYFRGLAEAEFSSRMDKLRSLTTLNLAELDTGTADEALRILARYSNIGIGGRDAVVLATMQLHGVKRILTHDRDFRKIKGIRVIDPIPPSL